MKIHKIMALGSLLSLAIGSAIAGSFSHTQNTPGSYATWVTVPSAATCQQYGGAYLGTNYITNYGPLGNFACNAGQSFNVSGSIAAGDWYIDQDVFGAGYSGVVINW